MDISISVGSGNEENAKLQKAVENLSGGKELTDEEAEALCAKIENYCTSLDYLTGGAPSSSHGRLMALKY